MWAPADLFTPGLSAVTLSMERVVSYLSEHLLVLMAVIVGLAALITVVTMVTDRRERRS